MAEKIVAMALQQVLKILQQELELVKGVKDDVHKLQSNLESIHGVLAEAERRQIDNPTIKQWLDNLKELSYRIDDVLDEWSTLILKAQMEKQSHRCWFGEKLLVMMKKVCSLIPISCFSFTEFASRDRIAREIKGLNARLDEIAKERERYSFGISSKANDDEFIPLVVSSAIDVAEVKGRDTEKTTIVNMLVGLGSDESVKRSNLMVVSIVGTGGLGKTTLAKLVYNDRDIGVHFESRIWVSVSKPFDDIKVAKAILEILTDAASFLSEYEAIMHHIEKLLEGKRFLLVLDDVWEDGPTKWERMRYSFNSASLGSCVLVTTRDGNVAGKMGCTRNHLFQLGKLSLEDCWSIFSEIAFFDKEEEQRRRLEVIGRNIVKKCDGLPLAAKTLGCNLRLKNSREEWENVLKSEVWELEGIWGKKGETRTGFSSLWYSYYDLVSELRPCFSYCALLPQNHEFKKDDLIQLWMAQGYLRETASEDMERIGDRYFQNLVARSFFEDLDTNSSGNVTCKMYNMMHDFAKYIRKDECLSLEVNNGEEFASKIPDDKIRHLRLTLDKDVPFPKAALKLKNLRSLRIQTKGNSKITALLPKLFKGLTCLRYLSLSNKILVRTLQSADTKHQLVHQSIKAISDLYISFQLGKKIIKIVP